MSKIKDFLDIDPNLTTFYKTINDKKFRATLKAPK